MSKIVDFKINRMDSMETKRPLTDAPAHEVAEAMVPASTEVEKKDNLMTELTTKEAVIERLNEINQREEPINRAELDQVKQIFYKLLNAETEAARKTIEEAGGDPAAFFPKKDECEAQLKAIMSSIKEKRNAQKAEEEQEQQENLKKKQAILERMKELVGSPEEANKAYNEFKQLQADWSEIKEVPATNLNELWKSYQLYTEQFYDMLKLPPS